MAKRISNKFIQELLQSANITDIVSKFVKLKKSGKSYKGCCPFHNENTPSFFVTPDKGVFHCFGCHKSGDILTFVKEIENIEFIDAIEYIADFYGQQIEYENYSTLEQQKDIEYKKVTEFLNKTYKYYRWCLSKSPQAIDYLKSRAITSNVANEFGIGFAVNNWRHLSNFAKKNIDENILLQTGLAIKNDNNSVYDRFRNRIMFPIRNIQGQVVGYGGRAIDDGVKYINSPETIIFSKSKMLYGLYEYRQYKKINKNLDSLLVVEGYMDVVGLAQNGFYGAVATLGTAFSEYHARILFREATNITLCFDGDSAGQQATKKALQTIIKLWDGNKNIKILSLPNNQDPDDYINKNGLESFKNIVNNSNTLSEYLKNVFLSNKDLSKAEVKARVIANLKDFFENIENNNLYATTIISEFSKLLNISNKQLKELIFKKSKYNNSSQVQQYIEPIKIDKLTLIDTFLAEILANPEKIKSIINDISINIEPTTQKFIILKKCLQLIKNSNDTNIQSAILIQELLEEFSYRDYFYYLLGIGIQNNKGIEDDDISFEEYNKNLIKNIKRIEQLNISSSLKNLKQKMANSMLTDIDKMQIKYLTSKLRI